MIVERELGACGRATTSVRWSDLAGGLVRGAVNLDRVLHGAAVARDLVPEVCRVLDATEQAEAVLELPVVHATWQKDSSVRRTPFEIHLVMGGYADAGVWTYVGGDALRGLQVNARLLSLWSLNPRLAALAGAAVSSAPAKTHPDTIPITVRRVLARVLGAMSALRLISAVDVIVPPWAGRWFLTTRIMRVGWFGVIGQVADPGG